MVYIRIQKISLLKSLSFSVTGKQYIITLIKQLKLLLELCG